MTFSIGLYGIEKPKNDGARTDRASGVRRTSGAFMPKTATFIPTEATVFVMGSPVSQWTKAIRSGLVT